MKATRFMRQPFFVLGHQVTEENMDEVAVWCEGHIIKNDHRRFIRVPVTNARTPKQGEASPGQWVLRSKHGNRFSYKVYTEDWLQKEFILVPDEDEEEPVVTPTPSNVRALPIQRTPMRFSEKTN